MKKKILIASAVAAGTVAFIYLMKRKNRRNRVDHAKRSQRSDIFVKVREPMMDYAL